MDKELEKPEFNEKHEECVKKVQAILDEYGMQIGIAGIVLIPK